MGIYNDTNNVSRRKTLVHICDCTCDWGHNGIKLRTKYVIYQKLEKFM